tara:strand:- start:17433 stop:18287 length:855 start_codon:yes stop_codon:yes gene_type:complete
MPSESNKALQLFTNLKHYLYLVKINELPSKSIYDSEIFKGKKNKVEINNNFILSSKSKFLMSSRINEFNSMKNYLSSYNLIFFNHNKRDQYMKKYWIDKEIYKIYSKSKFQQMKADIFRYCFLFDNGGYWLDIKSSIFFNISEFEVTKPEALLLLSPHNLEEKEISKELLPYTESLNNRRLTNWFIGAKKDSPFINNLIENIIKESINYKNKKFLEPKEAILNLTGPKQLTRTFLSYEKKENITVVDENQLNIHHESKFGRRFYLFENVFFEHYSKSRNKIILI